MASKVARISLSVPGRYCHIYWFRLGCHYYFHHLPNPPWPDEHLASWIQSERSQNAQLQQRMASLKLNMLRISSPPFECARAPTYGRHTKNDTFGTRVGKCPFHDHDHDFEPSFPISRSLHRLYQSWINAVVVVDFQPHHSLRVFSAMKVLRYLGPSTHSLHITLAIISSSFPIHWLNHNTSTCLDFHGSQGILAKILAKQLSVF